MNIGNLLGKVAAFAKRTATGMKLPKSAVIVDKINTTFNSKALGATAKKLGVGLVTANLTDKYIQDVPVANNLYNWYATTMDEIYENTVRQIPKVGDFLRKITDFINKLVVPNAQNAIERNREMKHLNKPTWYTGLDMHTEFRIPMVYPDNRPLVFGSDIFTAALAVVTLGFNPVSDRFAITSRLTQEMDLLKGIRGLSGNLPYSMGNLYYYHLATYYILNEYYKLKFAIRLSNLYILTKSRMPANLMNELGWDFNDFIENKALYITLLTQFHNFISKAVPMNGTMLERIKGNWDCLIPDSNDGKVALYYKTYLNIDGYILTTSGSTAIYERFGDKFYDFTPDKQANDNMPQCGRTYNMTYATYATNFSSFVNKFNVNKFFTNIKADLIGAFGQSVLWSDTEFDNYKNAEILGHFDELYLTQLQNATVLEELPVMVSDTGSSFTQVDGVAQEVYYTASFGGLDTNGNFELPVMWTGSEDQGYVGCKYKFQSTPNTTEVVFMPATDGRKQGWIDANNTDIVNSDQLTVIANKYKMDEGESLEIVQLSAIEIGGNGHLVTESDGTKSVARHFLTNAIYVKNLDILYHVNGTDQRVRLLNDANLFTAQSGQYTPSITAYTKTIDRDLRAQFWSQADYMPKFHMTTGSYTKGGSGNITKQSDDRMLSDINIMGSISKQAFRQAIKYSTYSEYAASVKVTETRRASNVADVYNVIK